jgi:hypothetical protein
MELMLYVDGELDSERLADVEAFIEESDVARRKVAALRMASGIVLEHTMAVSKPIDIASAVMAKIDAGVAEPSMKNGAGADIIDIREGHVAKVERSVERSRAANDNSRGIFTLAAIAVAAAAGMMIWGRMGAEQSRPTVSAPVMTQEAAPQAPAEPAKKTAEEPAALDGDTEHGVEVAAVDFGAHMGTIFYVPTDATAGVTTTVVWVDDDVAGGK